MSDDSDVLAAGLRELAEHEAPPAGERFEAGLRQALRWEQRRRRAQRRRLVALGCLAAVFVAIVVALAMPASARLLPSPVGGELRRLDAQTSDLQAQLSAQAAVRAQLSRRLAARAAVAERSPLAARRPKAAKQSAGPSVSDLWSGGWAYVRPASSPNPAGARPAEAAPLATPQSSSPTPTPAPTPSPTSP